MYQQKIIHRDWAFLSNSIGKDIKTLTNEEEGRKKSLVGRCQKGKCQFFGAKS